MWLGLEKDKMKNLIWVKYLLLKKIRFFKEIVDKELDWKGNFDDLGLQKDFENGIIYSNGGNYLFWKDKIDFL